MFPFERLIKAAAGGGLPSIETERLLLRPPRRGDHTAWARLRQASQASLQRWEPRWSRDHLSERSFRRRVAWAQREIEADRAYPFLIFELEQAEPERLAGGVTLEAVRRGAAQSAALGYWLGDDRRGRGLMTEGLEALLSFATAELGLSRIEAACLPENHRSRALLERMSFKEEALLRGYLEIDGAWRDHLIYARRFGLRADV